MWIILSLLCSHGALGLQSAMSNIKQDIFYNYDPNVLPQEVGKELMLTSFSVRAMRDFKPNLDCV